MTVVDDRTAVPAASPALPAPGDHRGSPIPTFGMIAARFKELRKRRGLMVALIAVTIGFPVIFLGIRLVLHAASPHTYGPAGGFSIYGAMSAGVLYEFGFIVAATLGVTAGSIDLTEGMFRHLVITGRSRVALYFARIPAGLAIIGSMVAIGFAVVCVVCCFAAPKQLSFDGVTVPGNLSKAGLESWAADHVDTVFCSGFNYHFVTPQNLSCSPPPGSGGVFVKGNGPGSGPGGQPPPSPTLTPAQLRSEARQIADINYHDYSQQFLSPSITLMVETGLWLELEVLIGFLVGLGLGSLIGQRTVGIVLMVILQIVLTMIFLRANIPHFINLQRAVVGVAMVHLEPGNLGVIGGGGGGPGGGGGNPEIIPMATSWAAIVVVAWLVGWTAIGAWRMARRDT